MPIAITDWWYLFLAGTFFFAFINCGRIKTDQIALTEHHENDKSNFEQIHTCAGFLF
jgi:hypothetical protein